MEVGRDMGELVLRYGCMLSAYASERLGLAKSLTLFG